MDETGTGDKYEKKYTRTLIKRQGSGYLDGHNTGTTYSKDEMQVLIKKWFPHYGKMTAEEVENEGV